MTNTTRGSLRLKAIWVIVLCAVSGACSSEDLCNDSEQAIFSFETKAKKSLSICKHTKSDYLVYRYGVSGNIEMQYPRKLDKTSWNAFTYSGMRRAGGKANAGFGYYDLSFPVSKFDYAVFQTWDDQEDLYSIGITIRNERKGLETRIEGLRETQKGSLVLLEDERDHISNTAM